jgi:hypothetical protein
MSWEIWRKEPYDQSHLETGRQSVMCWRQQSYWGVHPTRLDAMRRYVEEVDPNLKGAPAALIREQWKRWARSSGLRLWNTDTHP